MTSLAIQIVIGLCTCWILMKISVAGFACLSNPCIYGICIDDLNSTYSCYCIDGYTGIQCQTNWNECWSSPCMNGGTCIDGIASYNCSCPEGFVGNNCEINYDECDSNPCSNNGTCLDADNGYFCECQPGYSGLHCEVDIAVCNITGENRCFNGGLCVEGPGFTFFCKCKPGWAGTLCDKQINECESSPCQNGGVCIDLIANYACACHFGYTGQNCEENILICEDNSCENDALCLMEDDQIVCYCVPDYHGDRCQFQYDECQLGPRCMNGGTCIDGIDSFTCSCPPDLTGVLCECLILTNGTFDCTYIRPTTIPPPTPEATTEIYVNMTPVATDFTQVPKEITTSIIEFKTLPFTQTESAAIFESTTMEYTMPEMLSTIEILSSETPTTTSVTFIPEVQTDLTFIPPSTTMKVTWETEVIEKTSPEIFTTYVPASTTISTIQTEYWETSTLLTEEPFSLKSVTSPNETTQELPFFTTTEIIDSIENVTFGIRPDCTKYPCQNGGTCVVTTEGPRCVCKFDTEGHFCEVKLGIQNAAFSGDSYLSHQIYNRSAIKVGISVKTLSSTGLIFYSNLGQNAYMTLYILDGLLKFQFSCGVQTMVLSEMKTLVNNGYEVKILAHMEYSKNHSHCNATVNLNETITMSGDQAAVYNPFDQTQSWIHFGGVPQQYIHPQAPQIIGFMGCIHSLEINNIKRDIFKDAKDGFEISECDSLACLSSPCFNGATCVENGEKWSCLCTSGYVGIMCERSVCENNPCLFGASCVPYTGGFLCLCPFGKHGPLCEQDLEIVEPVFSSTIHGYSSFAAYEITKSISHNMEMKFHFVPNTLDQIALLMFIGQEGIHDSSSDHIAVSFVKGYVMLTWNLGSGPRRIFTSKPISLMPSKEHIVRLGRVGRRAWIIVDNMGNITGRSPGKLAQLDVRPIIYLGGHDTGNFSTLPHDLPLHTGFSGCIFGVDITAGHLSVPLYSTRPAFGRSVGQCRTRECSDYVCQNGGACLQHGPTFTCLCADGWFGQYCSVRYNPCDSTRHNCSSGSTCVPLMDGYECDCALGHTGKFCEKYEDLSDISFLGKRSYLKVKIFEIHDTFFNVEIELRPLNDRGLIFYIPGTDGSSFTSLYLQGGILELRIYIAEKNHLSTGELTVVRSRQVLRMGEWHQIRTGKYGKRLYLWTNEKVSHGGISNLANLPREATPGYPVPFTGCVRKLHLNDRYISLNTSSVFESRNIADCDGTPCGGDVCLHGGTCWLDSNIKPHCSCLEQYTGEHCQEKVSCIELPCKNHGRCTKQDNSVYCSCPLGWTGDFCEQLLKPLLTPRFLGPNSYIIAEMSDKLSVDKKRYVDIQNVDWKDISYIHINFSTAQSEGMLLWSDKGDEFLGIGIERGLLKIAWAWHHTDSFIVEVPAIGIIADGLWHNLTLSYEVDNMTLIVDGEEVHSQARENELRLDDALLSTNGKFYIGGFPEGKSMFEETNGLFSRNFEGCIEEIRFDTNDVTTDFSTLEGENIAKCNIYMP